MAAQNHVLGLLLMFDWVPEEANVTDFNVVSIHNDMKTPMPKFDGDAYGNGPNRMYVFCVEENAIQNKGVHNDKNIPCGFLWYGTAELRRGYSPTRLFSVILNTIKTKINSTPTGVVHFGRH